MISDIDSQQIQIRRDGDSRHSLTCHSSQVSELRQMWLENDFPLFEIRDDSVVEGGESDTQVTIVFGSGDPIGRYQQVLDAVQGNGLS